LRKKRFRRPHCQRIVEIERLQLFWHGLRRGLNNQTVIAILTNLLAIVVNLCRVALADRLRAPR
jgi:hypothetical protein